MMLSKNMLLGAIRVIRMTSRSVSIFFASLVISLAQSCSPMVGQNGGDAESTEEPVLPMEYVVLEANVLVFERMVNEGDPEEVISNAGGDEVEETLLRREVLIVDGDNYYVETNVSEWKKEYHWMVEVEIALNKILYKNKVTWCADVMSGQKFVDNYFSLYWDEFSTREGYRESIIDYVDCGSGRT